MSDWRDTRWLVVGLARSGCAAADLLARHGAEVLGGDDATGDELHARWRRHGLTDVARRVFASLHTGPRWWADLPPLDGIVVSPGVPLTHPALAVLGRETPVVGEVELAARRCAADLVAVTGTNGKTTTTELIAALLRSAGREAVAVGNVGRPFSDVADRLAPGAVAVVEVSSFQLESIATFAPRVGVVLNLAPDHLDRYPDLAAYHAAKRRLAEALPPGGLLVTATDCPARGWPAPRRLLFGDPADGADVYLAGGEIRRRTAAGEEPIVAAADLQVTGAPALANCCAAVAAVTPWRLPAGTLADGLRSFAPLSHRQQVVARVGGVTYVDDSKATNVHAVCAGLAGYDGGVVLILGGSGKGEDYTPLRGAMGPVEHVVLLGEESDRIGAALAGTVPLHRADDMAAAVSLAATLARPGGTVLLSPACASFDMFRDYRQRGEAFQAAVRRLPPGGEEGTP